MTEREDGRSLSGEQARNRLYEILHQSLPRKQALERVMDVGSAYLGIEHGHVTRIDEADNQWEVLSSTDGPEGPYPEGLTVDLDDTYCRRTMQQSDPLALHNARDQGWADDHAYQRHQLETYVGIRIEVFDEPYGTLCFVESAAREEPFSEAELIFMEVASHVLRKVLEESQYSRDIANRDRLISVLNRVLRHNLRNDLNVVQGYAELIRDRTAGETARMASSIYTTTTDLLSLAEKSRTFVRSTQPVPVARPTDIVPVVEESADEIRDEYPSVEISVDTPDEATAFAAPQLAEAVKELLDNAARYGGTDVGVEVEIDPTEDRVLVRVDDDGPGLPKYERRILAGDDETALEHGSELGLALVFWIVANLDGEIDVTVNSHGTTIALYLQRAPSVLSGTD